jgi:hypothetical protein
MNHSFVLYRASDGVVVGHGSAPDAWSLTANGIEAIPGPADLEVNGWRVVDGELVARLPVPVTVSAPVIAADGEDQCVLSGLPDPCTITVRGAVQAGPQEVTGGSLTLTSTAIGAITISVTADPVYKPWETTIHAT